MTVTEWFGKQDLGLKYGIVLGSLIFITIVFAVCKLIYIKRRVKKFEKEAEIAQSERREELRILNQRVEDEGDLFGIRALEKGFFGGVAQSRPATPVSIGSSTLAPPRSAHLSHRPSSELGYSGPMHRTPAVGHFTGLHGSAEMHFVLPQAPTTAHRHDRSRSPSPTGSTNSQTSTVNAELPTRVSSGPHIQVYSNSPLSLRT